MSTTTTRRHLTAGATTPVASVYSDDERANRSANQGLLRFVEAYRLNAHLQADLDPLGMRPRQDLTNELDHTQYGLNNVGVYDVTGIMTLPDGSTTADISTIIAHLQTSYCGPIGVEAQTLRSEEERRFFADRFETLPTPSLVEKRNILSSLVQCEAFDKFMTVKFASFKRYGAEGAESMLPAMEALFVAASRHGIDNVVLGMPHRGRFNLLVALLDYPARAFFAKVKGASHIPADMDGWCDVASHIAQSVTKKFDKQRPMNVTLLHNPSHLEAVNPVAQGKTRAKMDITNDPTGDRNLCLQLHGDAAFAGQGIVPESLQMAHLAGFQTGGTVHMIVNNQLGFTTDPSRSRSTVYSSDIARMLNCPVIHVNAERPEHVVHVCKVAMEYRQKYRKDVIIDLIGYRKWGHNEVDEPSFTQPAMYTNIRARKSVAKQYEDQLMAEGVINDQVVPKLLTRLNEHLEAELAAVATWKPQAKDLTLQGRWKGIIQAKSLYDTPDTGVDVEILKRVGRASVSLPDAFSPHSRVQRSHIEPRLKMVETGKELDWATTEAMAFGSIMNQGINIRICGQDVERGTFSQRYVVLVDQKTSRRHTPLTAAGLPGRLHSINSHLSEEAVLGFELGYNWEAPNQLNIWEAQFGDFHNGAQIIIDTFITSAETKWLRQTGLVMLLPHGFDGAGPEHSSCRVERFLQLVDSDPREAKEAKAINFIVANPSTPANYFHLLRRQVNRPYRKPLVVVGPKQLLRHSSAVNDITELAPGTKFESVLGDDIKLDNVSTIVVCSGKVYYDLHAKRAAANRDDIAFIRIEELAPFPFENLQRHLSNVKSKSRVGIKKVVWFQEEPLNAGAWLYAEPRLATVTSSVGLPSAVFIGRPPLPLPAVGSGVAHKAQEEAIYKAVFAK